MYIKLYSIFEVVNVHIHVQCIDLFYVHVYTVNLCTVVHVQFSDVCLYTVHCVGDTCSWFVGCS